MGSRCVTLESKLSSAFTACPSSTKMSTTLVFVVSVLMSTWTRMTLWRIEYSDTMSDLPFTSVMKRSRARLLHWFPRMMDWAEGRIPLTWNSWAWDHEQSVRVLIFVQSLNMGEFAVTFHENSATHGIATWKGWDRRSEGSSLRLLQATTAVLPKSKNTTWEWQETYCSLVHQVIWTTITHSCQELFPYV